MYGRHPKGCILVLQEFTWHKLWIFPIRNSQTFHYCNEYKIRRRSGKKRYLLILGIMEGVNGKVGRRRNVYFSRPHCTEDNKEWLTFTLSQPLHGLFVSYARLNGTRCEFLDSGKYLLFLGWLLLAKQLRTCISAVFCKPSSTGLYSAGTRNRREHMTNKRSLKKMHRRTCFKYNDTHTLSDK